MPTPSDSRKRIMTISLEGQQRAQAFAMWDGERLIVLELREIVGDPETWLPDMLQDINAKVESGWVVMVEDRTASFSTAATAYNFDEMGENGRTQLQEALDWYFSLDGRGAIILGDGMERYAIRRGGEGGLVDCTADEKGRMVYKIDWNRFGAGHKAMLMAVVGAVIEEPLSERWLRAMGGVKSKEVNGNSLRICSVLWEQYEKERADYHRRVDISEAKRHV